MRLVQYEMSLERERKQAQQALAACHASEQRAKDAEARAKLLETQLSVVFTQRSSLAVSLDQSLRQLGTAHEELHSHRMRMSGKLLPTGLEKQPGSWGLLQDLHQLHLKLHDGTPPAVGAPPSTVP